MINRPPAYSLLVVPHNLFTSTKGFAWQHHCSLFLNVKVKCVRLVIKVSRKVPDVRKWLYVPR